jgi:hypothetical protein
MVSRLRPGSVTRCSSGQGRSATRVRRGRGVDVNLVDEPDAAVDEAYAVPQRGSCAVGPDMPHGCSRSQMALNRCGQRSTLRDLDAVGQ